MSPVVPEAYLRLGGSAEQIADTLGPLASLAGTWVGSQGWNIIAVPSAGSQPGDEGDFRLLVRPYTETITFVPVGAPVRNRGGNVDQFVGALRYHLQITARDGQHEVLHVENGMWLYLADIRPSASSNIPFAIARSATVPHGDSALVLGNATSGSGSPDIPNIDSRPPDIGRDAPLGYLDPYDASVEGFTHVINPNASLREDIHGQEILGTTTMILDSENQGGIHNIPFIVRHANATRFQCSFWIETVKVSNSDQTYEQLQYSQIIDLDFHKKFGGAPGLITWPHVNVNTLKKQ